MDEPRIKILSEIRDVETIASGRGVYIMYIIDEDLSELDGYLYPASMLVPVELPEGTKQGLMAVDRTLGVERK